MSIRRKIILIIMVIVLVITAFTLGVGMVISQHRFFSTVEVTLLSASKITSGMFSAEVDKLQNKAKLIAGQIRDARPGDLQQVLDQQMEQSGDLFLTLAVMNRNGLLSSAGNIDARPPLHRDNQYSKRAFTGETSITTTSYTPEHFLVMRIWTPIDENRVLAAALSGLYLSDFLSPYHMWETGSIYVVDSEGVCIAANQQTLRVLERHNYIEWGKHYPEYQSMGLAFQNFLANDEGTAHYSLSGVEQLCAYSAIPGTDGWTVVVTAPLNKSPVSQMRQMLILCCAIVLALGIATSLIASNGIAAPYKKMEELQKAAEAALETKSRFLANVSREMHEPLSAIIGISEMEMGSSKLEGNLLGNMEKINAAGATLMNIINNFSDISKIVDDKIAADQPREKNKKFARADMSYANVLVVDDMAANLDITRGMLKPYKLTVDCVTSGQEAIERVREEKIRYNAIFMDHLMPEMDGLEATRVIRNEIATDYAKTVPIIALTANTVSDNDKLFLENGFQAFLSKPIDIHKLDDILNRWVALQQ